MELTVTKKVFNPELVGKAVRIKGFDSEGYKVNQLFLVKETEGEKLGLISQSGSKRSFLLNEFEEKEDKDWKLTLTVLEENLNGNE